MTLQDRLDAFVQLCEGGHTIEAIEGFYAEDAVVFENNVLARAGRDACVSFERAARARVPGATLRARAHAVDGRSGVSFIEWTIRFVGEEGRPMRLDEVAVQRWSGDRITQERFYYEGVVDEGDESTP